MSSDSQTDECHRHSDDHDHVKTRTTIKTKQANSQQTKTKAEHHAVKQQNKKTRINNQFQRMNE